MECAHDTTPFPACIMYVCFCICVLCPYSQRFSSVLQIAGRASSALCSCRFVSVFQEGGSPVAPGWARHEVFDFVS